MRITRYIKFAILLIALSVSYSAPVKQIEREDKNSLSQSYAEFRSSLISGLTYDLSMTVDKGDTFSGTIIVGFAMKEALSFTIDFAEGTVSELVVNGKKVKKITYNGKFITIPKKSLKKGGNTVRITYKAPYSKTGNGLYKFLDPEDNTQYIYSDFEPYDANLMFPCFDQPDLKAMDSGINVKRK
jgi:aminopeptidase N